MAVVGGWRRLAKVDYTGGSGGGDGGGRGRPLYGVAMTTVGVIQNLPHTSYTSQPLSHSASLYTSCIHSVSEKFKFNTKFAGRHPTKRPVAQYSKVK